jgi:alpha-ketoglutarate-dependent taurine dioxygenase
MTAITVDRLTPTVGALVEGVDVERLVHDETLPGWTLEALEAHGALVFRGLHMSDADQVAFSKLLGSVEVLGTGDYPEIFRVTLDPSRNPAAPYLRGTFHWHIDGCTDDVPIMATMLSAHEVAAAGGETEFASSYQAYEDLSEEERHRFESIRVVHTIEASMRLHTSDPTPDLLALWRRRPAKEHPLVWTHRSGRKSLVLGATTDHVVGMDPDESRMFLDGLVDRATGPDRVYRHEWQVGDVVIWDNRGVLHRAAPYDPTSPRDMHRTTFAGDEPIA